MARGEKSKYTEKQKREAEHIAEGYEKRGVPAKEAKRRAWATENAMSGGGRKSGSGRGKATNKAPAHKGGAASAARPAAERSASARKAARTRKRHEQHA
jgi:plasmid stabilization system protein ParE